MKKAAALFLAMCMIFGLTACQGGNKVKSMSHAEYVAAAIDSEVTVAMTVQATQSWWDNKITVYGADKDGAYFVYELACTEADAKKLTPGTGILVKGTKAEWSGEVEIADATFEFYKAADGYKATAADMTALLGKDELIDHQNELVSFKGMTIEDYGDGSAFAYKNPDEKTDDLYFKASKDGNVYNFCVEFYLCGKDTDVYKAVENLQVGDVVDLEGFLYWYEGANPHITSVTAAK